MSDWIKLHRSLLDWEWYTTPNMVHFWIHCILKATHRVRKWKGIDLCEGQFISGRLALSAETGLSEQQVRTCIDRLKSTNELTSQSTREYSVFTINSWKKYQLTETSNQPINQPATNEQPTSNQRATTDKKDKKDKNVKKERKIQVQFAPPTMNEVADYFLEKGSTEFESEKFCNYYESKGWIVGRVKMKNWRSAASGWMSRQTTNTIQYPATRNKAQQIEDWNLLQLEQLAKEGIRI